MDTPHRPARLTHHRPAGRPRGSVLLLHGAGSDTSTPVLLGLADALAEGGLLAVRVDQPYRVAGRRAPAPAPQLDAVVRAVAATVRPAVTLAAGRSSGARVACRVAASPEPPHLERLLAFGFPLLPPRRPGVTRRPELAAAGVPVLVIQGERDAFGAPADIAALALPGVTVHAVAGADHALASRRRDGRSPGAAVAEAVEVAARWLLASA